VKQRITLSDLLSHFIYCEPFKGNFPYTYADLNISDADG